MSSSTKELFKKVRENHQKLSSCSLHNFGAWVTPAKNVNLLNRKYTCKNCDGEKDMGWILTYIKGYTAAGGNQNDILQGFK